MKVVILAGGLGTRISEETHLIPKPMIEIGGKPILWHIMKIYSHYGFNDFIICGGYKEYVIKEYFQNYFLHNSDVTFDIANNSMEILKHRNEPWKVTIVNTGETTNTGGRLKKIKQLVNNQAFCMTYGDGVGDIDIKSLVSQHNKQKPMVTLTTVKPHGRFGSLNIENGEVKSFAEYTAYDDAWINAGFMVIEPDALDFIEHDDMKWEEEPLEKIASKGGLGAFKHNGFWQPMDTLREKNMLESLWENKQAPWKVW